MIREQARWYEHGKKSTKYFLKLEKINILKLRIRNLIITDPSKVLSEQKRFYQEPSTIQTGQYSQRELIKCWNVKESMGLALCNICNDINVCCPIWWVSVFR